MRGLVIVVSIIFSLLPESAFSKKISEEVSAYYKIKFPTPSTEIAILNKNKHQTRIIELNNYFYINNTDALSLFLLLDSIYVKYKY